MPEMNPPEGPSGPQPTGKSKPWPNVWMITTFAVLAVFAVSMFLTMQNNGGITGAAFATVPAQQIGQKTVDFITNDVMGGQSTATFVNITEKNGLYFVTFDVEGKAYSAYVSKDGKMLFPQVLDMTQVSSPAQTEASTQKSDNPVVQFFVMSFCPYGQQAEAGLKPVAELFKGKAIFEPHYVVYNNYCGYGKDPSTCKAADFAQYCIDDGKYCSLHGVAELNEDVRQMFIYSNYPDKFWTYVNYVNTKCSVSTVDTCWKDAAKVAGLDTVAIENGAKANTEKYVAAEQALDKALSVQGSPTIFVNDVSYSGGRAAENFKAAVCAAFTTSPAECSQTLSGNSSTASGSCATG